MNKFLLVLGLLLSVFMGPAQLLACDPCSILNASRLQYSAEDSWTFSLSEEYTKFHEAPGQLNSKPDSEEVTHYSSTQLGLGYDVSDEFGLQLVVPFIYQESDKIKHYRRRESSDSGLGDVTLALHYTPLRIIREDAAVFLGLTAGIKFPTGDSGALTPEEEEEVHQHSASKHHTAGALSGVRGLTLGSGSYDFIYGLSFFSRYQRLLLLGNLQYSQRNEGDFNYEFSDDLVWDIGPGAYLALEHDYTLSLRAALSGEQKASDRFGGDLVEGSSFSTLFVGPQLLFTWGDSLSADLGIDFPVYEGSENSTVETELRIQSGISYRFG